MLVWPLPRTVGVEHSGGSRLKRTDAQVAAPQGEWLPTEDDIHFYETHGWWVSPRVFSDQELERATEAAFRFYQGPDISLPVSDGYSNWTAAEPPEVARNNEFVSLQSVGLRALAWSSRLGAIAARLARTDQIRLLDDQLIYKPPHTASSSAVGWHADHAYWATCTSNNLLTAWIPFHAVDEERGTLVVLDGSHRWADIEHARFFSDTDLARRRDELGKTKREIVEVPLNLDKGQVSFHHCWTLHASHPNRCSDYRLALAVHLQDGANTYQEAFTADGSLIHMFDEQLCRRLPDGRPDFADPAAFPVLWPASENAWP